MAHNKPAVIVISSHVVRGTVGNRAAAFALEVLGFPVWTVPTVTLPWHPGQGLAGRITPSAEDFAALMQDLAKSPWLDEVGAVLSGYLGGVDQVAAVSTLVDTIKSNNENALYVLDPVMGDAPNQTDGRLYVPEQQARQIREHLLKRADMVTPNPFELGFLAGRETPDTIDDIFDAAMALDMKSVLATSAPAMIDGHIGNLLVQQSGSAHLAEHRFAQGPPNGLGDLAAALMLGNVLDGNNPVDALCKTSASLYEVMMTASRARSNELLLEASIGSLINPTTRINGRALVMNISRRSH